MDTVKVLKPFKKIMALLWLLPVLLQAQFQFFDPGQAGSAPATISALGLYSDISTKTIAPGVQAYDVNLMSYSPFMEREMYLALPAGTSLTLNDIKSFTFPEGAVLIRNIFISETQGDAGTRKLVETQLLINGDNFGADYWHPFSYQWLPDGSDANLVNMFVGVDTTINIQNGGTPVALPYRFYSTPECVRCHVPEGFSQKTHPPTSFRPTQVNRVSDKTGGQNQIAFMETAGLIGGTVPDYSTWMKLAALDAAGETVEHRVRSYFAANCAYCHNAVTAQASFEANPSNPIYGEHLMDYHDPALKANYIYKSSITPIVGQEDKFHIYITPQNLEESWIYTRMAAGEMPPDDLTPGNFPDTAAVALLAQWIGQLVDVKSPRKRTGVKPSAFLRHRVLVFKGGEVPGDVRLFSIDGARVKLKKLNTREYFIDQNLVSGIYIASTSLGEFFLSDPNL